MYSEMLRTNGIGKGDVCAIVIRHNSEFYPLYMGVVGCGAVPAVLAYPNTRLHPEKFIQGIEGMSQRSGLDYVLTERDLESLITPFVSKEGSTVRGIHFPLEWQYDEALHGKVKDELKVIRASFELESPLLLQHSSGTTGLQKPVLLSHKAVIKHSVNYGKSIRINKSDKTVSWLPLYHDMGLIAVFHLALASGITLIQLDPFEWVLAPSILLEAASSENATLAWLPNFAFSLMADKIDDYDLEDVNLKNIRLIVNCSEPVRYDSMSKFADRFSSFNLNPDAISCCYAMAEAAFAVTQTEPGLFPKAIRVDRKKFAEGKIEINEEDQSGKICVSSGKPIQNCSVKIVDENRHELAEGYTGEVAVWSEAIFNGYRNYPEKTAEVLEGGWYYTGDIGFVCDGYYYIIGRKKDIIIVAGKNIYPEDVEAVVTKVEGVIPGRVVAFGQDNAELGTEQISIIAETAFEDEAARKKLRIAIVKAGTENEYSISKVYLAQPRWLIKSSAGKPSRKANKERILNGEIK